MRTIAALFSVLLFSQCGWAHGNHPHRNVQPLFETMTTSRMTCERLVTTRPLDMVDPLRAISFLNDIKEQLPQFAERSWRKKSEKSIARLVKTIEREGATLANQSSVHRVLTQRWLDALERASMILREHVRLSDLDKKMFESTLLATLTTLVRLPEAWLREEEDHLDGVRMRHLLDTIVTFDVNRPRLSFFQIRRAIEGRYSVTELANCR